MDVTQDRTVKVIAGLLLLAALAGWWFSRRLARRLEVM